MSHPVFWSPLSKEEYAELLKYLEAEYGLESALKFMDKMDEVVASISRFPESGRMTKKKKVRLCVITSQTSLIYVVNEDRIDILHLWDTRRDPDKLQDAL
ncbi:MAG: type II toxin-antitoxin system RelE/ParE family toxin [Bacteroidota bacterium]